MFYWKKMFSLCSSLENECPRKMKPVGKERLPMTAMCEHCPIGCSQQHHQTEQLNTLFYKEKEEGLRESTVNSDSSKSEQ